MKKTKNFLHCKKSSFSLSLSPYVYISLSLCLSVSLSLSPYVYISLSLCLSLLLSFYFSLSPSVSIFMSFSIPVYLSLSLSFFLFFSLCLLYFSVSMSLYDSLFAILEKLQFHSALLFYNLI